LAINHFLKIQIVLGKLATEWKQQTYCN